VSAWHAGAMQHGALWAGSQMNLAHWIWVATAAYGIHALEEFILDWRDWARAVIRLPVEWAHFYVVNFLVIVLGIVAANLAEVGACIGAVLPRADADQWHFFSCRAGYRHARSLFAWLVYGDRVAPADRVDLLSRRKRCGKT